MFLAVLILAGLVWVSRIPSLQISRFDVSGSASVSVDSLRAVLADYSLGNRFLVFPASNMYLYPTRNAKEKLFNLFPEIQSIVLDRLPKGIISVSISEKKPSALWCGSSRKGDISSNPSACLFLDEKGEAYKRAPQFSPAVFFEYYGPMASSTLPSVFLAPSEFKALAELVRSLNDIFPSTSAELTPEGDIEIANMSGATLKVSRSADREQTYKYLKAFLAGPSLGSAQNNPDKFEYIDLRFGKKIYYKLR